MSTQSGQGGGERFTCDWIFDLLVVLSDGKVVCGCADPYGERPLGHLKDGSILDIWRSARVREIREGLNAGYAS
ncbi:MAG: SPASM domain-containing protein, partial [Candidatus Aminicenantes bacterium]|nr:SPASM domain-containing protein [Candidatus Aminicenantes bacterium]